MNRGELNTSSRRGNGIPNPVRSGVMLSNCAGRPKVPLSPRERGWGEGDFFCARTIRRRLLQTAGAFAVLELPQVSLACSACYGASDAPMARGMNWGILSLLAIIGVVLAGVLSFFVYLGVRAANHAPPDDNAVTEPTETI